MAEAVLLAVTKIGSVLSREAVKPIIANLSKKVKNLQELPMKIEQIRTHLTIMSRVIENISTVYLTDKVVNSWIGEVRNVAYQVEDVLDKYSYHVLQLEEEGFLMKYFIKGKHYVLVFNEIVEAVAAVEMKIQQVIQLKDQWLRPTQLVPNHLTDMERQRSRESVMEFVRDEDLVGIKDNKILLTEWLYSEEKQSTVIAVSGMGGSGKSTLVANVYERERSHFPANAWIVVSQVYTVDSLLRKILRKIGCTERPLPANIDTMGASDLKKEIKQRLQHTKSLIVLDDVWEQEAYFKIHDAFQNLQASRILITTRKAHVAAISNSNRHLELRPLAGPDALELFCSRAFYNKEGHKCPGELEKIATSIVDRCHGLPLAIVTIGRLLSSTQRISIWNQTYHQLRTELSKNDHVRAILNLSYHDLSGELRNCFLYCSLFPEDYPMSREILVRLWVAEGFVLGKERNAPEVVAEGNLMELIHRKMLEVVDYDELGRVNTCKMHDIVRELAISVALEEKFAYANDYGAMEHVYMEGNVRRLSSCGWNNNAAHKVKLQRLRTVISLRANSFFTAILSSICSESSYLTALELQDSEITEVPDSIGALFNLRYISLRGTKVRSLPESVGKLSNLQTLDIRKTKIEKLPRGIVKIKKLRHLLADRSADEDQSEFRDFTGMRAPKELSNLEELQTLETLESSTHLAEQLKKLVQLRSLWINNIGAAECANLFTTLSSMPLLSSLLLSARDENEALCFEALNPCSSDLHRLIIRGQWFNGTLNCPIFRRHGIRLRYLSLSRCHVGEDPLGMLAPYLPNLTYLELNNMHTANTLVLAAGSFPHLKMLVLKQMADVDQLEISYGALPCIEALYIVSLPRLQKVPHGIGSLRSLKKLWLLSLHKDFRTQWDKSGMHQKILHVPEVRV